MPENPASLYTRLGGYDAIAAVVDDLLPRLREDSLLGRFWTSPRSVDTNNRERQLAIDFIAAAAGGPTIYLGRDMKLAHTGMGISKADYAAFMRCLSVTLDTLKVPEPRARRSGCLLAQLLEARLVRSINQNRGGPAALPVHPTASTYAGSPLTS